MMLKPGLMVLVVIVVSGTGSAQAFEAYGFRSCMTRSEVQAASPIGFTYRDFGLGVGAVTSGEGATATVADPIIGH